MSNFKIATFNVENLSNEGDNATLWPARVSALKPMLKRINTDILGLQEVNSIDALQELIQNTAYESFNLVHTKTQAGTAYRKRNLVILSRFPIDEVKQYNNKLAGKIKWRQVTAIPEVQEAEDIRWERPILHAKVRLNDGKILHVINLHLKSKIPTPIEGQMKDQYTWNSHSGWAEGYFISSIKRVGQALETRILIDQIFEADGSEARIVILGDFNAEVGSVPFLAIAGTVAENNNPELRSKMMYPCEYNVPEDQRYSLIHHGKGEMIDHVIVSELLLPYFERAAIFNEFLPDESVAFATDKKFPESDHAPVVVYFQVPNNWV